MATEIPNNATNVNLGSYDSTDLEIKAGYFISGSGYGSGGTGDTAIYSGTGGITLTSDAATTDVARTNIDANNGASQASIDSPGGAGGIGISLQADDVFNNAARVQGGHGGGYLSALPATDDFAGAGGVGVALSGGATLNNEYGPGTITVGANTYFDGGSITGGSGGSLQNLDFSYPTGASAVGVEVAGGTVINSGDISGGGGQLNVASGAAGVKLDTGSSANYLNNTSTGYITGGEGTAGGGAGVDLVAYNQVALASGNPIHHGVIYNQGTITGGFSRGNIYLTLAVLVATASRWPQTWDSLLRTA
jgi:hypothetical protein